MLASTLIPESKPLDIQLSSMAIAMREMNSHPPAQQPVAAAAQPVALDQIQIAPVPPAQAPMFRYEYEIEKKVFFKTAGFLFSGLLGAVLSLILITSDLVLAIVLSISLLLLARGTSLAVEVAILHQNLKRNDYQWAYQQESRVRNQHQLFGSRCFYGAAFFAAVFLFSVPSIFWEKGGVDQHSSATHDQANKIGAISFAGFIFMLALGLRHIILFERPHSIITPQLRR